MIFLLGRRINVAPFMGMALGFLPLVPALTGFGAVLLFFSSDTMTFVFAILSGFVFLPTLSRFRAIAPLPLALVAFAFFILVGRYLPGPAGPQGDEPHYLLIAESLLHDQDVDLKNQFEERAFSKFTGANLEPHTAPRSPPGHLYAIHTPGLSALVAPGYALDGFAGARAVVSGVMAVVVGLLYFVSRSLFGPPTAGFVFLLATFASPLPIYANSLFPDSVATLPVAVTFAYLVSGRVALLVLSCATIATLPWLHPRFLPLALLLAFVLSARERFSWSRAAGAFGPLLGSLGLLLWHFQALFGSSSLSAAYGPGFASDVSLGRIPRGALALIFDRQFGLLLFSPVLLFGLAGASSLWKRNRAVTLLAFAVFGSQIGAGGAFSMWWGGASAPARFLIAAVPALLIVCGAAWSGHESRSGRRLLLGAAAGFGSGLLFVACLAPRALHNRSDGESGLLRLLAPVLDLDRFFPGFVGGAGVGLALGWALALVLVSIRPRFGVLAVSIPLAIATLAASTPLLDPFASSLRVLESWTDHRRSFGGQDTEAAFSLSIPLGNAPWDLPTGERRYSPRFSLPKGAWTLRVESRPEGTPGAVNLARISLLGETEPALVSATIKAGEEVAIVDFDLNTSLQRVNVLGEGLQSRTAVLSVRLTPRSLTP